jgi:hypothetical protein
LLRLLRQFLSRIRFPIFSIFQQMLRQLTLAAFQDELQLLQIRRPRVAVAELKAGELRFVKRAVRVTRTEIQMLAAALGKKFGSPLSS